MLAEKIDTKEKFAIKSIRKEVGLEKKDALPKYEKFQELLKK